MYWTSEQYFVRSAFLSKKNVFFSGLLLGKHLQLFAQALKVQKTATNLSLNARWVRIVCSLRYTSSLNQRLNSNQVETGFWFEHA